jgi:hypothetical protein
VPPANLKEDLPGSSAEAAAADLPATAPDNTIAADPSQPRTHLQSGIRKEKRFTDGIVWYGILVTDGEPNNLEEALQNKQWRAAMDDVFSELQRNKT